MRRNPIRLLVASILLMAWPALADVPAYHLDKDKSFLKFDAIQNGSPVVGEFKDFTADIHFDPDQLDKSTIRVEVQTGSVTTANDDVEKNLKMPDWLSVAAFPTAVFTCQGLTRMPRSNDYYGKGELTLRGKTVPVELNFQMEHFDGHTAIANGYVTLLRDQFGVGQGQWAKDDVIKNEVRVEFRVTAEKE